MKARVCICCGQPMPEMGSQFSRDPNLCPDCCSQAEETRVWRRREPEKPESATKIPEKNPEPTQPANTSRPA